MLNLGQVTLFCVDTRTPDMSIWAMNQCLRKAKFNDAILVTDKKILHDVPKNIRIVSAPPINCIEDYSDYLQSDLSYHIQGTHLLVMQWDSFIVDPELWDNQFLDYDYIGAPWPHHPDTPVGNGGFSLRSRKLFTAMQNPLYKKMHPEDQSICIFNRAILENNLKIRFAPPNIAKQFAFEREKSAAFGFHGFFNFSHVLDPNALREVIEIMPIELLGKLDTYDLIDELYQQHQTSLANLLLKKSNPQKKFQKMHLQRWLRSRLNILKKFGYKKS